MTTRDGRPSSVVGFVLGLAACLATPTGSLAAQGPSPVAASPAPAQTPAPAQAAVPAATPVPPLPAPVPGIPVGWCIRAKGTTLEDAKNAGYEYVELALQDVFGLPDAEFEAMLERVRSLGIPVLGGYNLVPNDLKVVGPEIDKARQDEHLKRALARVARLGARHVILNNGKSRLVPEGFPREQAQAQLVEFCRRAAEEAGRHDLTVLLEPLRPEDTNLVNTVADALALVRAVDHPHFEMMVDYSFLMLQKDDPKSLREAGRHLKHVHIANPNGRVYPMDEAESDYASFFGVLAEIGYRGGLSVHAGTKDFAAEAPRAITFLRRMAARLSRPEAKPTQR